MQVQGCTPGAGGLHPKAMEKPEDKLQYYRNQIDEVDELLARLLVGRMEVIRRVGQLKKENWPNACHIRPAREGQMHHKIADRFKGTGFPPQLGVALWRLLIGGSTHLESPLNVSYLRAYPEHRFFAREYFGVQSGARAVGTLSEALGDLRAGLSNIVVLPSPESNSWWMDSNLLLAMNLRIFAALPVDFGTLPADCTPAIALSTVTPEDSGDDISYFINADGGLEIVTGFVTERTGATFLGAHPAPLTLKPEPK